jgi:AmiR/NasT family two-component response regulator
LATSPADTAPAARTLEPVRELVELRTKVEQLQTALDSRVLIEQAKGVLSERHGVSVDVAFDALRRGSRRDGRKIHDVAREVVATRETPAAVAAALRG